MISNSVSTGTSIANVRRWRPHLRAPEEMRGFWPDISWPEPTLGYGGETINRPLFVIYLGKASASLEEGGTEGDTRFIMPFASSQAGWPETEYGISKMDWIKVGEPLSRGTASVVVLTGERASYDVFLGRETRGDNQDLGLPPLQAVNPGAAIRIRKLAKLEPDWDGYGGEPPTEKAIKMTAALLIAIHRLTRGQLESPFIAPLSDGGLELEWELDSGVELMLVIPPTGTDIRFLLDEPKSSGDIFASEGLLPKDATITELIGRLNR